MNSKNPANVPPKWRDILGGYPAIIDATFLQRWGDLPWQPTYDDQKAAAKLHMQFGSRVTTQPLSYLDGVEKSALESVYANFKEARTICEAYPLARHFERVAWHVMNSRVRPFTAKWHRESERGALRGLDATDEFRAELSVLQGDLMEFLDLLLEMRDGERPPPRPPQSSTDDLEIAEELKSSIPWGIPSVRGGVTPDEALRLNEAEKIAIHARRAHYHLPATEHASALALSGGGIRSATFSLGVLVALAKRGILPQFDYLSTVSGGGFLGSFLSTYLNSPPQPGSGPAIGLESANLPFSRTDGEAAALRHIRHHSKYLATGGIGDRLRMAVAQLYGMMLNGLAVVFLTAVFALLEHHLRVGSEFQALRDLIELGPLTAFFGVVFAIWAAISLILIRRGPARQMVADVGLMVLAGILFLLLMWPILGRLHRWVGSDHGFSIPEQSLLWMAGAVPVLASAFASIAGKVFERVKKFLGLLSILVTPLFFFGVYLALYHWSEKSQPLLVQGNPLTLLGHSMTWLEFIVALLAVVELWFLNVNFTSPHRHYRNKLAEAYLIQPAAKPRAGRPFDDGVSLKLSSLGRVSNRGPYHLVNAALNVPASKDPTMQGRLTDFFLFSPSFCGSPLTGYQPTDAWEEKDSHLDLGTAMAISGAAAAPQMGLGTKRRMSFWLALLNVRLGYWVRKPSGGSGIFGNTPGLRYLLKEMRGSMSEKSPWLFLSDGGHIENLAIYELLRRRCKFIVAIDGEQDERMTFAGLTTLQRLAKIDMEIEIEADLDDLRLDDKGFSRSHFRFCRIIYSPEEIGYLLYIKLSLTGNEGEFLKRYRLDEPDFPHHPTTDQFFSEAQFEAYRSLGEHIGEKLFLRALVGSSMRDSQEIALEDWFARLAGQLLNPRNAL